MPLYEYQCDACGARFERIRKFSDPPLTTCPTCGKEEIRKLVSSPAFQFKGSGWYITDYARKSGAGAGGESGAKDGGGAATESRPDGKSDGKQDGKSQGKSEGKSDGKADTSGAAGAKSSSDAKSVAATPAAPAKKDRG